MSEWIQYQSIQCPYCAEEFEIEIDTSVGADIYDINAEQTQHISNTQHYIEDCYVCCRPIKINITHNAQSGTVTSTVNRLDD